MSVEAKTPGELWVLKLTWDDPDRYPSVFRPGEVFAATREGAERLKVELGSALMSDGVKSVDVARIKSKWLVETKE